MRIALGWNSNDSKTCFDTVLLIEGKKNYMREVNDYNLTVGKNDILIMFFSEILRSFSLTKQFKF